jgi:hypothetical protein
MHPLPSHCPFCHGEIIVAQLRCIHCDTKIEGEFRISGLAALKPEHLEFVEVFLRCEGKINRVEKELGISYPTVRSRLNEVIVSMGYEPSGDNDMMDESQREAVRRKVLEDLSLGTITPDQAVEILQKNP